MSCAQEEKKKEEKKGAFMLLDHMRQDTFVGETAHFLLLYLCHQSC